MNLDDFIITCFCVLDEMLPEATQGQRLRQRGPMPKLAVIFPYFCRVTKHEPVVHRQQGSNSLTMSGVFVDCRTPRSTQKSRV